MGLFSIFSKKRDSGLTEINNSLYEAFGKVKQETSSIFSWIRYLRDKDIKNDWSHENISYVLGEHGAILNQLKKDVEELKIMSKNQVRTGSDPDPGRIRNEPKTYRNFEKNIIEHLRPNRKDFVLQQMLNLAAKKTFSTKQIEKIIVEEKGLCSRTTFYDYLRELKHKNLVKITDFGAKKALKTVQNDAGSD